MYKTIKDTSSAEVVEKKSKFIANMYYVENVKQAEEIIQSTRKKYYDARHNCFAYNIKEDDLIISRSSDDGEPSGTAGAPMLNIIQKNELNNVLVVVTRYFGGILLGTGGLVKAYSEATISAIKNAQIVTEEDGFEIEVVTNYNDSEKFKTYCNKNSINIINSEYSENVKCIIEVNEREKDKFIESIKELNFKIEDYKIIKNKKIQKNIEK